MIRSLTLKKGYPQGIKTKNICPYLFLIDDEIAMVGLKQKKKIMMNQV